MKDRRKLWKGGGFPWKDRSHLCKQRINPCKDRGNRLTNLVDAAGTTKYTYALGGQLETEDGPFASDTVTNIYNNRLRVALGLQQPTGAWTNGFGYDAAKHLTSVVSPAGTFGYTLGGTGVASALVKKLLLPNTSYITNTFDGNARLLSTVLKNSSGTVLNSNSYSYNPGNQRTQQLFNAGSTVNYTYDPIGHLKFADSATASEDRGYKYDAAWNLAYRTNNTTLQTFKVDGKNQLTNYLNLTQSYDSNGNITNSPGPDAGIPYVLEYDDENQLTAIYNSSTKNLRYDFKYDGLGRLRVATVSVWTAPGFWQPSSAKQYVYDGRRVIQERDISNTPNVSYTRGSDLSGSLEGAGGIGGMLGRSHGYSAGNWSTHNYYHADGNGNITYLVNSSQTLAASYRYDAYGNTLSSSGSLAATNTYCFSSKESLTAARMAGTPQELYYYGYRWYAPNLQRWLNRDPLGEFGSWRLRWLGRRWLRSDRNLYRFVANTPLNKIDAYGLEGIDPGGILTPPIEDTPVGCAEEIQQEVLRAPRPSTPDSSGRYQHCLASCRISRECPGGRFSAWAAGDLVQDSIIWPFSILTSADPGDRAANKVGRDASCNEGSCEDQCKAALENGSLYPPLPPPEDHTIPLPYM